MTKIDKTSRLNQTRIKSERKKVWKQPSSLDAPPAPTGFKHRWIRLETQGYQDTGNVSKRVREGYEFVRSDELEDGHGYPVIAEGNHAGIIGVGGLALARIPEEIVESRNEHFRRKTKDQMNAVDNDLLKEQRPEMPMSIDRSSQVSFGGKKK